MTQTVLGIIGGSGVYDIPIEKARWRRVSSPWGEASDEVREGEIAGLPVVFLPRHGRGHVFSPSSINYRANIDVMKRCGVTDLFSLSAVGSLREDLPPGHFVLTDQYIDKTYMRENSFFGTGCVAHVPFGEPASAVLRELASTALTKLSIPHRNGGTLVVMEGPQFSSKAESELHRSWGAHLIGMTAMPEVKLAREAEISYCNVSMVTDFDSWHPHHEAVDVAQVIKVMKGNVETAKAFVLELASAFPKMHPPCVADTALDFAIMTAPDKRDPALLAKLDAVAGRVLKA
ncbi:S-methyl-5'-thioadenosine phosphorylase [Aestuariivirga litoralis]|uniref:S-methyl-5'-thioadenosine phosphorylase n=1 Tax=Aestuariivirga litoralis TaxID=2650924 RepID=UPI0018C6AF19|nr:S-methyl-5'-thioadenosine phosphorylase [Aestuariivirga litoralis]MBG1231008.1 S-methyl-5'-thioadenosine phosphorylase [Aestuariivirga litoralis]